MKKDYCYQALTVGWIAGMRSMSALAISTNLLKNASPFRPKTTLLQILSKPSVRIAAHVLTFGELIGDKLPATPNRIEPAPLTGRALMGGLAGAVIYSLARRNPVTGALLAGATAIVSSYVMYELRKEIKAKTAAPDLLPALAEDAIVLSQVYRAAKG
jgi:uncharacterized membrane protein